MSRLVSAFAFPASVMSEVQQHLKASNWSGFWQKIRPYEVGASFPFSGYVVVVAAEYLRQQGQELPVSTDVVVQEFVDQCQPLVCTTGSDAAVLANNLAEIHASEAILADYWKAFTGTGNLADGATLRFALDWLQQALSASQTSDWSVIVVG